MESLGIALIWRNRRLEWIIRRKDSDRDHASESTAKPSSFSSTINLLMAINAELYSTPLPLNLKHNDLFGTLKPRVPTDREGSKFN
jgi:hypothetical protein